MNIKDLYEDNIEEYEDWIDEDVAENMSRLYYRGVACHDDTDDRLLAALIWELKSVEAEDDTEAEIGWFYCAESEYLEEAIREYKKRIETEDVSRSFFESTLVNKEMGEVLKGEGFDVSEVESKELRIPLKEFGKLPVVGKKVPSYIQSIDTLDKNEFNRGMIKIIFQKNVGALEDMCYLPKSWYDGHVSCCVKTDGKVNGFLLVHAFPSGTLMPVLYYATGPDSKFNLAYMMRYSILAALDRYPEDTTVIIKRRSKHIEALTGKMFPGAKGENARAGERSE